MAWIISAILPALAGFSTLVGAEEGTSQSELKTLFGWVFFMIAYWLLIFGFYVIGYSVGYAIWSGGTAVFFTLIASFTIEKRPSRCRPIGYSFGRNRYNRKASLL